jgi:hypothetical protein
MGKKLDWDHYHSFAMANDIEGDRYHRNRRFALAKERYEEAAKWEVSALEAVDQSKRRTFGVLLISAVSLFIKADMGKEAKDLAVKYLDNPNLPGFAKYEIQQWFN